ncbi:hypothetical protein HNV08_14960 [Winogradskyella eckloniae]|uniref:hypothetical protein n=1 Tax=Winogradskyella eckloniae TaxID=1089306 RepID=UPI00156647B1|nr:hypothetical protein [Winogradskyella eckloniae]NRD21356.1 hypothetical protein [Winogradskyella eckloniae]
MKKLAIVIGFCLLTVMSYAQVGIGNTNPDPSAALDITATDGGLLVPRVSLINVTNNTTPIAAPALSLLVWNTNAAVIGGSGVGYYYWNGTNWTPFLGGANTLDQAYDQGGLGVGRIIYATHGDFEVSSGRVEFTHTNDASGTVGSGVLEINNSLRLDEDEVITNTNSELFLQNGNNGDFSVDNTTLFVDASTDRVGVGNFLPNATLDVRGSAIFNDDSGDNDFRIESDDNVNMFFVNGGTDRVGIGTSVPNATLDVRGSATFNELSGDHNFRIESDDVTYMFFVDGGTNRVGIGDSTPDARLDIYSNTNETALWISKTTGATDAAYIENGGSRYGLYINNTNPTANAAGLAVIGDSNNQYAHGITAVSNGYYCNVALVSTGGRTITGGVSGVNGGAEIIGVHGRANNSNLSTTDKMGGFFTVSASTGNTIPAAAAVGSVIDNITYKILGFGAVSTLVRDSNDEERIMVAPEAPEALFQDYGTGQLSGGKATINLDPILTKNIHVSEEHPLKVFIQLEGDCNGVYVTNKTANGFEVVELNHGVSNTKFSYQIVARRADEERGGRVSKYSDMRFKKLNRKFVVDQEAIHGPAKSTVAEDNGSDKLEDDTDAIEEEENKEDEKKKVNDTVRKVDQ